MADEAFALSPISARAAQPREEDYDAISQAFMETSRGRWFLGEYAKRNRNADTRMVLDAVARIEENLAAQKQTAADDERAEALAAIRNAVDDSKAAATGALDGLALELEEGFAPVRKGARVIREIAWRLREIGADGRICDLIDSQIGAMEAGCARIADTDIRNGVTAAFDLIEKRIDALGDQDSTSRSRAKQRTASSAPAPSAPMPAAAPAEAVIPHVEVPDVVAEAPDAQDEAMLDRVAFEMAAPDPVDSDDKVHLNTDDMDIIDIRFEEAPVAETKPVDVVPADVLPVDAMPVDLKPFDDKPLDDKPLDIEAPDIEPADLEFAAPQMAAPKLEAVTPSSPAQPAIQQVPEPSLGSTLLANGIVRKPTTSSTDPLAPIRRISQAEKIALFS